MEKPSPLLKEIAYPGSFVDASGRRVVLTVDDYRKAISGSQTLIDAGFKIRGFSSHFTDDSKDVLGTWTSLYLQDDRLFGVIQPHSEQSRAICLDLDTSMIIEEGVELPNGVIVELAITRVDIVPQGAIVGTAAFVELARCRPAAALLSRRILMAAAEDRMGGKVMKALAAAMGMDAAGDVSEDMVENYLNQKLGLADASDADKACAYANAFTMGFGIDEGEDPVIDEGKTDEAKMANEPPMADEEDKVKGDAKAMSALSRRIEALENDKIETLVHGLKAEDCKRVMSRFSTIRKAAGFDVAFETARDLVSAFSAANPANAALAAFSRGGQTAQTERKVPENDKKAEFDQTQKRAKLAMARAVGIKITGHEVTK